MGAMGLGLGHWYTKMTAVMSRAPRGWWWAARPHIVYWLMRIVTGEAGVFSYALSAFPIYRLQHRS